MRIGTTALAAVLAFGSCCTIGPALASDYNPAGVYVGAAVGQSNVRNNGYYSNDYYGFDNRDTSWQLTLGVRPVPVVGVEYDYMNFGSPNDTYGSFYNRGGSSTRANAVFGVGYLPLPLPFLDIYGKAGVARLQAHTMLYGAGTPFDLDYSNTDFAYGAGTQFKFGNFAVRAEYDRIRDTNGDPDMLSVGVNFIF